MPKGDKKMWAAVHYLKLQFVFFSYEDIDRRTSTFKTKSDSDFK